MPPGPIRLKCRKAKNTASIPRIRQVPNPHPPATPPISKRSASLRRAHSVRKNNQASIMTAAMRILAKPLGERGPPPTGEMALPVVPLVTSYLRTPAYVFGSVEGSLE